jgi:O-antigen ligase
MKRRLSRNDPSHVQPHRQERWSWSWFIVASTLLLIPLIVDVHGQDSFRAPKELTFRASAIALLITSVFWASRRDVNVRTAVSREIREPAIIILVAIVLWTGITTLTSVNRTLSVDSLITVIASAIIFLGCRAALARRPLALLNILIASAVANAALAILQRVEIWQPFSSLPSVTQKIGAVALLGNTNDVGAFLVLPAIAALIAAVLSRGALRAAYFAIALVILAGLLASFARTSIIACAIALIAAGIRSGGHVRRVALLTTTTFALLILWPGHEIGRDFQRIYDGLKTGNVNRAMSGRMPSFLSALEMFRDHPLVGTGPGTFEWLYMRYRLDLGRTYPGNWLEGFYENFGEVHSDHLQVAAETGLPGYILLLMSLTAIVRSRKAEDESIESRLAHHAAIPIAIAAFTIMIAHFPLQTASARVTFLMFAALCTTRVEKT